MKNRKLYDLAKASFLAFSPRKSILFNIIVISVMLVSMFYALSPRPVTAASTITMGETSILSHPDSGNGGLLVAQKVSLTQQATLQTLSFYVNTANGRLQLGLYDDSGGSPHNLLASSTVFTPTTGWNTVSVTHITLSPGNYWLAYLPESNNLGFAMDTTGSARWFSTAFGAMPGTFAASPNSGTYHWSFYATLAVTASPTATPTFTPTPTILPSLTPTVTLTPSATPTSQSTVKMGETNLLTHTDNGNGGLLVAQQATLSQPATLQSLSFYVISPAGRLQLGLYDDQSGKPHNLLASTPVFTPVAGWNTLSLTPTALAAGTYWLAYLPESSSLSFPMDPSGSARWFSTTFGSMPATFSSSPNSGSYHWSFYATLTVNAIPTPTVTNTPVPTTGPSPTPTTTSIPGGMLRVDPANPRYFTDGSGKAILLVGDHTWNTLVDNGPTDPPPAFDYNAFLNFLQSNGINFFRMFVWEQAKWSEGTTTPWYYSPNIYARTGPGTALDGKPKFDLTQFNQAYFDRLRQRVIAANQKGIYVSIQLFDSFSVENKGYPATNNNPWPGHPYNINNNINNINGDTNNNGQGEDTETLVDPNVTAIQDAYVKKVVDTVNDLNVLYEICNEADGGSAEVAWENHMIDLIHSYEATKPYQHPVGFTVQWPGGSNSDIFNSNADWVSPNGDINNPMIGTGNKVIINDTDHISYPAGDRVWAWKSFTNGLNPAFMDPYDCTAEWSPSGCNPNDPTWVSLRKNLGYILSYAKRINLEKMLPHGDLSSSGYALANPDPTTGEYLVYLPSGGSVTVDLTGTSGTLSVEWFNPSDGTKSSAGTTTGGAKRSFTAPFSGDAVLYIHH